MTKKEQFIPTTMAREIAPNIFFRPIRSWHSGTYAGEKLKTIPGTNDGSGCMSDVYLADNPRYKWEGMIGVPKTVTHRLYWHKNKPTKTISAFLSYPNKMSCINEYFWEIYPINKNKDTKTFTGNNAEKKMELEVTKILKRNLI